GAGITPEALETLFESFTQVDTASNRRFRGTGLGLAISQGIARLLGGSIDVDSEVGRGSRFTLTIPAEAPASGGLRAGRRGPRRPASPRCGGQPGGPAPADGLPRV